MLGALSCASRALAFRAHTATRLKLPSLWNIRAKITRNLSDQWTAVQDKETGGVYYWNRSTNETTAVGAPKPGTRDTASRQAWIPVQDKATGGIYHWNPSTNETTAVGAPNPDEQQALFSNQSTSDLPRKAPGRIWDSQHRVLVLRREAPGSEINPLVHSMLFGVEAPRDEPIGCNVGAIIQIDEARDRALVAWRQLLCPSLGGSAKFGPTIWEGDRSEGWLRLSGFAEEDDPEILPYPCQAVPAKECDVTLKLVADRRVHIADIHI